MKRHFESIVVSPPAEGTASPSLKATALEFFFISLGLGIYWIGDWKSYGLYLMCIFKLFSGLELSGFPQESHNFIFQIKIVDCAALNRSVFLICSSFHTPILLQEWFLFWKGTVTLFCKICIINVSEVLLLPKPQTYQIACSTVAVPSLSHGWMYWTTLSLWLYWRLGAFSKSFPYCTYSQPAPTDSKIKTPSWEQIMELCLPLSWGLLMGERGGGFRWDCHVRDSPGRSGSAGPGSRQIQ